MAVEEIDCPQFGQGCSGGWERLIVCLFGKRSLISCLKFFTFVRDNR
jgi:hypothetical protein